MKSCHELLNFLPLTLTIKISEDLRCEMKYGNVIVGDAMKLASYQECIWLCLKEPIEGMKNCRHAWWKIEMENSPKSEKLRSEISTLPYVIYFVCVSTVA